MISLTIKVGRQAKIHDPHICSWPTSHDIIWLNLCTKHLCHLAKFQHKNHVVKFEKWWWHLFFKTEFSARPPLLSVFSQFGKYVLLHHLFNLYETDADSSTLQVDTRRYLIPKGAPCASAWDAKFCDKTSIIHQLRTGCYLPLSSFVLSTTRWTLQSEYAEQNKRQEGLAELTSIYYYMWNVNLIKDRVKQQKVLQNLNKLSSYIVFLLEFHLKPGEIKFLKKTVDERGIWIILYIKKQRSMYFDI